MPEGDVLPGWPGVAIIALMLLRDELRAWRIARELREAGDRLERSTVLVRGLDDVHQAAAGVARRRRRGDAAG